MNLDHTLILATPNRLALDGKHIAFRLPVAKTRRISQGIGILRVCDEGEGKAFCMLDVTRWPDTVTGALQINEFWFTDEEMDLIRPSQEQDAEIECIDLRISGV